MHCVFDFRFSRRVVSTAACALLPTDGNRERVYVFTRKNRNHRPWLANSKTWIERRPMGTGTRGRRRTRARRRPTGAAKAHARIRTQAQCYIYLINDMQEGKSSLFLRRFYIAYLDSFFPFNTYYSSLPSFLPSIPCHALFQPTTNLLSWSHISEQSIRNALILFRLGYMKD